MRKTKIFIIPILLIVLFSSLFVVCLNKGSGESFSQVNAATNSNFLKNGDFSTASSKYAKYWLHDYKNITYDSSKKLYSSTVAQGYIKYSFSADGTSFSLDSGLYCLSLSAYNAAGAVEFELKAKEGNGDTLLTEEIAVTGEQKVYSIYFYTESKVYNPQPKFTITEIAEGGTMYLDNASLVKVDGNIVTTESGASIRSVASESGLRFKGQVNKTIYENHITTFGADNVETGIMIMPEDYLENGTFDESILNEKTPLYISAKKWNNEGSVDTDGYYGFNCVLASIKAENTDREFIAIAYLKYASKSGTKYFYASYDKALHCRSVYDVAKSAKQELENEGESGSKALLSVVNSYLDKIDSEVCSAFTKDGDIYYTQKTYQSKGGILKILNSGLDGYTITVMADGEEIIAKNGYYEITENSTVKVIISNVVDGTAIERGSCSLTLKLYKTN